MMADACQSSAIDKSSGDSDSLQDGIFALRQEVDVMRKTLAVAIQNVGGIDEMKVS
jgi:hypothetical protein